MKYKVVVEYEYPVEHKTPVKAELILHGDRVETWNVKPLEQESVIKKIRAELIQSIQNGTIKIEDGNEELFRILDKYKAESEDKE